MRFTQIKKQLFGITNYMKPFDYVMIVFAVMLSFAPHLFVWIHQSVQPPQNAIYAIIKIDGDEVERFVLKENGHQLTKIYYPHENQYNIIEIDHTKIRVKEDNSPNQIAVMTGWIDAPGETSICLPHNFIIEIIGTVTEDELILPL